MILIVFLLVVIWNYYVLRINLLKAFREVEPETTIWTCQSFRVLMVLEMVTSLPFTPPFMSWEYEFH
jgi:hypothetical protein